MHLPGVSVWCLLAFQEVHSLLAFQEVHSKDHAAHMQQASSWPLNVCNSRARCTPLLPCLQYSK